LFEELTCKEHLKLVCKLRGITKMESIEKCIELKTKEVDIESEIDK
jgi:ABC-type multidrug transport system ATPase subunit